MINFIKPFSTSLISLLMFLGCSSSTKNEQKPDLHLANQYGIDSTQLVYQYYQKFGFTDVCQDIRMFSVQNKIPKLNNPLPITTTDLNIINNFPNKTDSINSHSISFKPNLRNQFYDIELEFVEFIKDSSISIQLKKGRYEIIETEVGSTLKVFDQESELLYIESHSCDRDE